MASRLPLRIGSFEPVVPVVLAPMAGVTNAAFRQVCRSFAPDLVYVNEMVMATAVVHGNEKTERMMTFGPDERPRSLQIYGSDPDLVGRAVFRVCDAGRVDHVDLNFGCPAAKVTRRGGGAAVPAKPHLLEAIVRAAVRAADPYGVPVTAKFRMGLRDDLLTYLRSGTICAEEGVAWIALHARTVEQHYAGDARWEAIAALKATVGSIPVLGNGDVWEAHDALRMMRATGCNGVVVGRGCLGRPWLFRDLADVFAGREPRDPPGLREVFSIMLEHARLLAAWFGERHGVRGFRKHGSWYTKGFPHSARLRPLLMQVETLAQLEAVLEAHAADEPFPPSALRVPRGKTGGTQRVALPEGWLLDRDDPTPPGVEAEDETSGG